MATRDVRREEFSSSNIVRSVRPNRPLSPPQKHTEFDNNLGELTVFNIWINKLFINCSPHSLPYRPTDHLLDDLQTSVSRTAQHLNASKNRDVQYLSPSNSTTVVQERSVSPAVSESKNLNFQFLQMAYMMNVRYRMDTKSTRHRGMNIRRREVAAAAICSHKNSIRPRPMWISWIIYWKIWNKNGNVNETSLSTRVSTRFNLVNISAKR